MWGIFGMARSWGFLKCFHISFEPFCFVVIEQNVITPKLALYISTCDLCGINLIFEGHVGHL